MPIKKAKIDDVNPVIEISCICPYCKELNYFDWNQNYGIDEEDCYECGKTYIVDISNHDVEL